MFGTSECACYTMNSSLTSRSRRALFASLAPDSRVALGTGLTDPVGSSFTGWSSSSFNATLTARPLVWYSHLSCFQVARPDSRGTHNAKVSVIGFADVIWPVARKMTHRVRIHIHWRLR